MSGATASQPVRKAALETDRFGACTEFVGERWGTGEESIWRFAPVTWRDGVMWTDPMGAKEATLEEMQRRAQRIWRVVGSFWNPCEYLLLWQKQEEDRPAATCG